MDPLTVAAGLAAVAGSGVAWRLRRRVVRAERQVACLQAELQAERHAASHDPLTGLPNRRAFYRIGSALLADPTRYPLVAVVVDLDDFKQVNDLLGHAAGDEVLVAVARRFALYAGDNLVARLGGDEFAGLLASPTVESGWLNHLSRRLSETLAAPIPVAGDSLTVTASIGLVPISCQIHLAEALHHADAAMYRAKLSAHRSRSRPSLPTTGAHRVVGGPCESVSAAPHQRSFQPF